jgi:hypothetical protein
MPTIDIALNPTLAKDVREIERLAPIQVDARNVRPTSGGNQVKRNGYTEAWDIEDHNPIILLIPENDGYAFCASGKLYSLGLTAKEIKDFGASQLLTPQYVKWDNSIIITTGLSPIKVTGDTAVNLGGSPVNAKFISMIAGYTFLSGHDPTEIRWSAPGNPENYVIADGSGFTNVNKNGTILHQTEYNGRLFYFKEKDIEVWNFKGAVSTADSPIARYANGTIAVGLGAKNSVVKARNDLYWFGDDGEFYVHGQAGTRVIPGSMRRRFDDFNNLDDLIGMHIIKENLVQWVNAVDGITISYDYSRNQWLEDNRWDKAWQALPFGSYMELNRKQYYGSGTLDGLIYDWDESYKDDNGQPIRVYKRVKHMLSPAGRYASVSKIRLRRQGGVATSTATAPVVSMRWRFDEGPWSNWRQQTLGATGVYDPYKAEFRKIGRGREIEIELEETDATDFLMTNMFIEYTESNR